MSSPTEAPTQWVDILDLRFDPCNPRLVEYGVEEQMTQDEILETLKRHAALDSVAMSIAASGYWAHEPLIADQSSGQPVVLEGNRRLAAVRLMLDDALRTRLRATDLPELDEAARAKLRSLPVIFSDAHRAWQYLAYKHVNGPARWGSYAKARYIARVKREYGVPLDEIARQIGDRHATVRRLYRAIQVLDQAVGWKAFDPDRQVEGRFFFSHLFTGLGLSGFQHHLDLADEQEESPRPVPESRRTELAELLTWVYGDARDRDKPALVQSQNPDLRRLDQVLQDDRGVEALRAGLPLAAALDVALGDERVFKDSLRTAKLAIQKAVGTSTTGYDGKDQAWELACEIDMLVGALMEAMGRQRGPQRPRTRESQDG